uniref:Uncharacterized protein n=1 Tax=Anguilla anguilla TaxID=7936 RepID=A0A0E9WS35_ANGAN
MYCPCPQGQDHYLSSSPSWQSSASSSPLFLILSECRFTEMHIVTEHYIGEAETYAAPIAWLLF